MHPLGNLLPTHLIVTGSEISIELYPNSPYCWIHSPLYHFGNSSVCTQTCARRNDPNWTLCYFPLDNVLCDPAHITKPHPHGQESFCHDRQWNQIYGFRWLPAVATLSADHYFKLPFELLEVFFRYQEAWPIWESHLIIIIWLLPNIVDYILHWMWEDVIQRTIAAATMNRILDTRCTVGLLAIMNNTRNIWVIQFQRHLYPSSSSSVIEDWGNIPGARTAVSSSLLLAAQQLSDIPAGMLQIGNCSIPDWWNVCIDDWYNYRKYRYIILRPVPWD